MTIAFPPLKSAFNGFNKEVELNSLTGNNRIKERVAGSFFAKFINTVSFFLAVNKAFQGSAIHRAVYLRNDLQRRGSGILESYSLQIS